MTNRLELLTAHLEATDDAEKRRRLLRAIRHERREHRKATVTNDAHVAARHAAAVDGERQTVASSVAMQRRLFGATGEPETIRPVPQPEIKPRSVPDPLMTPAEIIYQRARNPDSRTVGKATVAANMLTLIGALTYIRRAQDHHKRAAEWFKGAYESLYGGIAPSIDLGKIRVDTSIMAHDNGAVDRLDQGRALQEVIDQLGKDASNRIIACTVLCIPCAESAPAGKSGKPSGHAIEREVYLLLLALDAVAEMRGFSMVAA